MSLSQALLLFLSHVCNIVQTVLVDIVPKKKKKEKKLAKEFPCKQEVVLSREKLFTIDLEEMGESL
jgi:hypothetical protein